MRILISNDDGIHAEGLYALKVALDPLGEVVVVAPERPRSASGHAITLHKPVRIEQMAFADGSIGWACSGTPTDCVTLGVDVVMKGDVDLVFSGINDGPNLGWDLTYSGTVAAAMEGAMLGVPSVAISVAETTAHIDYAPAAAFAARLALAIQKNGLADGLLLNVNVPALPVESIKGVAITHQGKRQYIDRIHERVDPWGRKYYWIHGTLKDNGVDLGSDVHQVFEGNISVTPVHLDLTAATQIETLLSWKLK